MPIPSTIRITRHGHYWRAICTDGWHSPECATVMRAARYARRYVQQHPGRVTWA